MRFALLQLPRAPGLTDKKVVAALLDTKASRKQAVEDFGWKWAMELEDKQLLPLPAYQDRDFLSELVDQRSKASASKKRSPSFASASVRPDSRPSQRPKFNDFASKGPVKMVRWTGNSAEEFDCPDKDDKLAEPLPDFFLKWIDSLPSPSNGSDKKYLPSPFVTEGTLRKGHCFYKGCGRPGHSWDHCPRLALHIAKNPAVRNA